MTEHLDPEFGRRPREDYGAWYETLLDKAAERWTGKSPGEIQGLVAHVEALIELVEWLMHPLVLLRKVFKK